MIVGTSFVEGLDQAFKWNALRLSTPLGYLSQPEIADLAGEITARRYTAGESIAVQGEPGDELLILIGGEIEVVTVPSRKAPAEKEKTESSPLFDAMQHCLAGLAVGGMHHFLA